MDIEKLSLVGRLNRRARYLLEGVECELKTRLKSRSAIREAFQEDYFAEVPVDLENLFYFRAEKFPKSGPVPWLDRPDALEQIEGRLRRGEIDLAQAELCRSWVRDGFVIVPNLFDGDTLDRAWADYESAIASGKIVLAPEKISDEDPFPGRYLNPHLKVPALEALLRSSKQASLIELLLGKQVIPFQTITSHKGSGQLAHSDSIHMTTYPLGYMTASWIAFEDIHPDSGPLFYYPGSHRLPYLFSKDVGIGLNEFRKRGYALYAEKYEPAMQRQVEKLGLAPRTFCAKRGDLLLWHANLIHGGSPRKDVTKPRRALVCHFFSRGAVCYHDLTGAAADRVGESGYPVR